MESGDEAIGGCTSMGKCRRAGSGRMGGKSGEWDVVSGKRLDRQRGGRCRGVEARLLGRLKLSARCRAFPACRVTCGMVGEPHHCPLSLVPCPIAYRQTKSILRTSLPVVERPSPPPQPIPPLPGALNNRSCASPHRTERRPALTALLRCPVPSRRGRGKLLNRAFQEFSSPANQLDRLYLRKPF